MKITKLQVTIEPLSLNENYKELRVSVVVDGRTFGASEPAMTDDFESMFDVLMYRAKRRIELLIKNKGQKLPKVKTA